MVIDLLPGDYIAGFTDGEGCFYLRCGKISFTRIHDTARYNVQNIKDIVEKVIPFFEKYPLRAKKRQDFELRNLYNNKYRRSDNKRLVEIRNEMRKYNGE